MRSVVYRGWDVRLLHVTTPAGLGDMLKDFGCTWFWLFIPSGVQMPGWIRQTPDDRAGGTSMGSFPSSVLEITEGRQCRIRAGAVIQQQLSFQVCLSGPR